MEILCQNLKSKSSCEIFYLKQLVTCLELYQYYASNYIDIT